MDGPVILPNDDGVDDRIRTTVRAWQSKLLDLTGRNRALNFKPARVSTVTIVDEQPAELFRRLYLEERSMRFKAAPDTGVGVETRGQQLGLGPSADGRGEPEEEFVPDIDFVPYDPAGLDDRHRDAFLQTAARTGELDRSLRRIDEQTRASVEELGVNPLFLTLGMLNYRQSADSEIVLRAPLVLLPVELSRSTARSGYAVTASDDEPVVNPSLREYLARSFGIQLPDLPAADAMRPTQEHGRLGRRNADIAIPGCQDSVM
jgi:hypothetical protein